MKRPNRSLRRWLAFLIWVLGLIVFASLAWWNLASGRKDAENRLISEAGRTAAQIAGLLALPGIRPEGGAARAITAAALDDERVYAIKISMKKGFTEGLRRNYMWEPVPWDDEIAENCVQGMSPIRVAGRVEGKVDVWLSPRSNAEDDTLLDHRERLRLFLTYALWTLVFVLLLWYWGEFRHFRKLLSGSVQNETPDGNRAEEIVLSLAANAGAAKAETAASRDGGASAFVSASLGREFQKSSPDAWLVTAGLFRQTFGRAPELISRLYAEGETAGLCHLGRMLEQAAPCVGAAALAKAAKDMQQALNDPACKTRALPVEICARILEQTLDALGGGPGKSAASTRSSPSKES